MPDYAIFKLILITYLLGSIPFGFIMGKLYGIDIRKKGSGNIGFTNVWRTIGPWPAAVVLVFDAGKGWLSAYYGFMLGNERYVLIASVCALLGHLFSVFLKFRGGKGVATGFGICLYIDPGITGITLVIFLLVVFFSKYISAGSLSAALSVSVLSMVFDINYFYKLFIIPASVLVIIMHKENIKRLLKGTENKIGKKEV